MKNSSSSGHPSRGGKASNPSSGESTESLPDRLQTCPTSLLHQLIAPLGSLKLTVMLFLMSIFIVFVGTLAQTEKDIWQVVHDYFRMDLSSVSAALQTALTWIDIRIFFPQSFFPHLAEIATGWERGFWFPNGWLIGLGLSVNLIAAHALRFRVQATGRQLQAGLAIIATGTALTVLVITAGSSQTAEKIQLFTDWPSLRILWLLTQCSVASLVLLGGCAMVFHKRFGIVLLHAGIGLLMFGELLVGISAVEGQMQIIEGQTVNYVLDTRNLELAIVDSSGGDADRVVAIPTSSLGRGEAVSHEDLPFDVELVEFMANSQRQRVQPGKKNPATAGIGRDEISVATAPVSSTDRSGRTNHPAAYVRFIEHAKADAPPSEVRLVTLDRWMAGQPERLEVAGRQFEVSLRYKHLYKPYSMHLIDVKLDQYMGTQTAKGYSSELHLVDEQHNVDRRVKIWMNNPLRFAGETFYQSSYGTDPASGLEYTGLQVVTNTGWKIPYMSCAMVSWGMLAQFWLVLTRFLKRRQSASHRSTSNDDGQPPQKPRKDHADSVSVLRQIFDNSGDLANSQSRWTDWVVPAIIVVLCAAWLLSKTTGPRVANDEIDLPAFGRLPVMYEGRVKPFDTLARNSLRIVSDRQSVKHPDEKSQPAIRWLLDVITDSDAAMQHRVFRIHNLDVLETLGLKPRKGFRYSLNDFRDKLDVFDEQVGLARSSPSNELDLYGKKILELNRRLDHYSRLRQAFRLPQLRAENMREDLAIEMSRRRQLSGFALPLSVPPIDSTDASKKSDAEEPSQWQAYTHAMFDAMAKRMVGQEPNPATLAMAKILAAYDEGSDRRFNRSVKEYDQLLAANSPPQWNERKTNFEAFFNHFSPIFNSMVLYLAAFVLACLSWLGWSRPLNRAATWLILFTLIVHTFGLIARMYISGRPPVTNLYSSAVFLGWGGVLFGLLLERLSRIGVGNVIAAVSGFTALLVGFLLTTAVPSFKGDTFTVLVAVLDTQFWLATHVTSITLGYSTTFVAGLLGIVYIVRGVLTPSLSPQVGKEIGRMIYGTICFAIFFSFVGTVLGGLWADDSWGRFWGWDPKENGALIIVLWNAVVLHAMWGGLVKERGLAVLAIGGNIMTAWSWFGVNELGVGLHTYGFTEGVLMVLGLFALSQLAVIAIGLIPVRFWWSRIRFTDND